MARLKWLVITALVGLAVVGQVFWLRAQQRPEPPSLALRPLSITRQDGSRVQLFVEVASTPEAWERGLMFRKELPQNQGMLFVFPQASGSPFWMKNTLIPLSIAFADGEGVILRILDMTPCLSDPCPTYYPGVAYRQALEVNQGWFRQNGVREGDRWRLE